MSYRKEYLEALAQGNGYDYISRNYNSFTKEELKDAIMELDYAIHCADNNPECDSSIDIYVSASEELESRWYMNMYIVDECDNTTYDNIDEFFNYWFVEDFVEEDAIDEEEIASNRERFLELKDYAESACRNDDWEA